MDNSTIINSKTQGLRDRLKVSLGVAVLLLVCCAGTSCSDDNSDGSSASGAAGASPSMQQSSPVGRWKIDVEKALDLAESSLRSHPSLAQYTGKQLETTIAAMKDSLRPSWASGRLSLKAGGKYIATAVNRPEQTGTWKLQGNALVMSADAASDPWILGTMSFEDGRIQVETPDLKNLVIPYERDSKTRR